MTSNYEIQGDIVIKGVAGTNGNIITHDATGKLLDSGVNIVSLSGDYVNISGDTMTGRLSVPVVKLQSNDLTSTATSGDLFYFDDGEGKGLYFKSGSNLKELDFDSNTAGPIEKVVITDNGNGTINVPSIMVYLYSSSGWTGNYKHYHIPAATNLALTDNSINYLVANYNSGTPEYQITTNPAIINNSNICLVATMSRVGTEIHYIAVDWGLATAVKLNNRQVNIQRFERSSGLALGESTGRVITIGSGVIWYGHSSYAESAVDSSSNNADFWYHSGGNWTKSIVSTYNNTQYDNGTNLANLGSNDYGVNWIYRYLDGSGLPKIAYILGNSSYSNLANAVATLVPSISTILDRTAILVGRIIVRNGVNTAAQIDSAFTQVFAGSTVTDHNNLSGLQGGTASEYYHLTSGEYSELIGATEVASISGDLQSQISAITVPTSADYVTVSDINQNIDGIKVFSHLYSGTRLLSQPANIASDYTAKTVTLGTIEAILYSGAGGTGDLALHTVPQGTITLANPADGASNYVYVDYNGGSPIYGCTASANVINSSNKVYVGIAHGFGGSMWYIPDTLFTYRSEKIFGVTPLHSTSNPDPSKGNKTVVIGKDSGNVNIDMENSVIGGNSATNFIGNRSVVIGADAANTLVNGGGNILIGTQSDTRISVEYGATAIGFQAKADSNSVQVGGAGYSPGGKAYGEGSVAIGYDSDTTSDDGIAIGSSAYSQAVNAVAIGADTTNAETNTVQFGNSGRPFTKFKVYDGATNRDLLAETSAISGALSNYTLLSTTESITANFQAQINNKADYNNLLINSLSSGIITGGILSINVDDTKFNVSAGRGVIVDNWTDIDNPVVYSFSWAEQNGISATYLATSTLTHIGVDRNGNIIQQSAEETNEQRRDIIMLGSLGHTNNLNIANVNSQYCVIQSPVEQYRDLVAEFKFISSGLKITADGASLQFNISSGTLYGQGINYSSNIKNPHSKAFAAATPATFQYRTQNGTTDGAGNRTTLTPAIYDVAGSLTAVPGASTVATNQYVYIFPNGNIRIQYGQNVYNTLTDAVLAIKNEPQVVFDNIEQGAHLLGVISVIKGATNLSDTSQARFSTASKLGENLGGSSAIQLDSYTLLSTTASISGNFQAQINGKADTSHTHTSSDITDFNEAVYDNIATNGMIVAGANITLNYDDINNQLTINSSSAGGISGIALLQGVTNCDTSSSLYTITHTSIDTNYSYPVVNLEVPTSGSNLFIQGVTNRTASSFQVTLSETPNISGYKILWHLPTSNTNVIGTAVVNQQMTTLPSYTTTTSGNYLVTFTDTVVYADNNNTILLPASPSTNEHHWIVNTYGADITVNGNGKNIWLVGSNNATAILPSDSSIHLHYNSTKDKWYII